MKIECWFLTKMIYFVITMCLFFQCDFFNLQHGFFKYLVASNVTESGSLMTEPGAVIPWFQESPRYMYAIIFHIFQLISWDRSICMACVGHIGCFTACKYIQYIPRNMHTVFALLCFVVVIHWLIFPYPSGLLHWHCGNLTIAPVPAKQPWWIWINTSCEFITKDCITTTKQSTTKPCAYCLGYTVSVSPMQNQSQCGWLCLLLLPVTMPSGIPCDTIYPKKYAHGFVVLYFVVVMQSFIMNSHEVFIHIHQSCFAGIGAIVRLPQCQWSKPDGYGKNSQCITTTKHSKAKTVCIFLGIYCSFYMMTSSNGNIFHVRGIHRSPVNSLHKGQWRGALMFSLTCAWING